MIPFELSTEESALVRGGFFRRSRENKGKTNMKQLKFMLAAATAISLATASQAAEQTNKLVDNENFDSATVGAAATTLPGYSYAGATAADNESVVKAGGYNGSANALQVNTGTDPLLRALKQIQGSAQALDLASYKSVYIDTMVQFTVTPAGDEVTPSTDDKLMIYLKEDLTEGSEATNLVIRAAAWDVDEGAFVEGGREYIVDEAEITPNNWYRLVVKAKAVSLGEGSGYLPVFQVCLGGDTDDNLLYTSVESGLEDSLSDSVDFTSEFISMTVENVDGAAAGSDPLKLTHVGFAGEGLVDNLTVATVKEVTTVDFTIAWDASGFSAVTYTINGGDAVTPENGVKFAINPGDDIVITPVLAAWYKRTDSSALTYTDVTAASTSVALTAAKTAEVDDSGNVTVKENTTATDLGIAAGSAFADANTTVLGNLMTWAIAATKGGATTAAGAATLVNSMTFDANDNPTSDAAKAYLLDCAATKEAIEDAREDFKLTISFDENGAPVVEGPDGAETYKNGNIVLKGRASLSEGEWATADSAAHNFFKAFLTK